ncbi:MAG: DUF3168 domain-containing protein [Pseudomonadota bacterium]
MSDPSLAFQKAVYDALIGGGVCAGRIYDRVPQKRVYPYATVPDAAFSDDGNSCFQQDEVFLDVHVYSRAVGHVEIKQQVGLIRAALDTEIAIDGFKNALGEWRSTRFPPQPDRLSAHAVVTFRYLIQHPASV